MINDILCPCDQKKIHEIVYSNESWKSLENISSITSFDKYLYDEIKKHYSTGNLSSSISNKKRRYAFKFPSIDSHTSHINLKSKKINTSSFQSLFITIHDIECYDFTNEFIQVYNGKIDVGSVDDDTSTILQRAIKSITPDIDPKILIKLSNQILSQSNYELLGLDRRIKDTLKHFFPKLPQLLLHLNLVAYTAQLFIGRQKDTNKLQSWLRVVVPINLISPMSEGDETVLASQQFSTYEILLTIYGEYVTSMSTDHDMKDSPQGELYLVLKPRSIASNPTPGSPERNSSENVNGKAMSSPSSSLSSSGSKSPTDSVRSTRQLANKLDKLPNVEVMAWGMNEDYSLGCLDEGIVLPKCVSLPIPPYLDPIKQIACGSRHTLLLTSTGTIYACGNNAEGALGTGDVVSRASFIPLTWDRMNEDMNSFKSKPPYITKIAAGGGMIGSHSMAVDRDGVVYGWGVAHAVGVSSLKPVLNPTRISFDDALATAKTKLNNPSGANISIRIIDVACGNCFTIALSSHGQLYSWGLLSHGRLGIGAVNNIRDNNSRRTGQQQQVRYKLQPTFIAAIAGAIKISCGDSHAMCVLSSGALYCWGKNTHGQIGTGPTASGLLKDAYSPTRIYLGNEGEGHHDIAPIKVSNICAGAFHSLAVDADDLVWSWGGRGSSCLGQGSGTNAIQSRWNNNRIINAFTSATSTSSVMVPYELLSWCKRWSIPRRIESFDQHDVQVVNMAAGNDYTAFQMKDNSLYLTGTGSVIPLTSQPTITSSTSSTKAPADTRMTINIPTRPPISWCGGLGNKRCIMIQGGADKIFALFDGESLAQSLTYRLYRRIRTGQSLDDYLDSSSYDHDMMSVDAQSISDQIFNQPDGYALLESYGSADCLIIATGKVLAAHRAVLAARSPVLRDLILAELPLSDDIDTGNDVIQLLLPELRADTASSLLYYIYTDSIPSSVIRNSVIVKALLDISKTYKIPRLQLLCHCLVAANTALELSRLGVTDDDDMMANFQVERPPMTLSKDMNTLVGDPQFADVRFIVDGKTIYAHRFILENRSEYFKAMFRSGMSESGTRSSYNEESTRKRMIDIVMPDSYFALLRMLICMYTDTISDAPAEILLEDLIMADRYGMIGMKRTCESMIMPSPESWVDVLTVAELINSAHLLVAVKSYLIDNMSILTSLLVDAEHHDKIGDDDGNDDMNKSRQLIHEIRKRFPSIFDQILDDNKSIKSSAPSDLLIERVTSAATMREKKQSVPRIPIWVLVMLAIAAIGYQYVSTIIVLGWIVPFVNIFFTIIVIGSIMYRIGTSEQ